MSDISGQTIIIHCKQCGKKRNVYLPALKIIREDAVPVVCIHCGHNMSVKINLEYEVKNAEA